MIEFDRVEERRIGGGLVGSGEDDLAEVIRRVGQFEEREIAFDNPDLRKSVLPFREIETSKSTS
jgi:hypothetical protein